MDFSTQEEQRSKVREERGCSSPLPRQQVSPPEMAGPRRGKEGWSYAVTLAYLFIS